MKFIPILMIMSSAVLYHACQKQMSRMGNPWIVLSAGYLFAFVGSLAAVWLTRSTSASETMAAILSPAALILGISCIGVEAGYVIAYRSGWNMGHLFAHTTVGCTSAVLLMGYLFYQEPVSFKSAIGLAFAALGVILMRF